MTALLNVGNTWDPKLYHALHEMNKTTTDVQIDCLYGSTTCNLFGNARSPDRLQNLDMEETKTLIDEAHSLGFKIAWTINISCLGNLDSFEETWKKLGTSISNFFEYLDPDILVVAHPLMMLKLAESGIDIPIEISTIAGINEPNQILDLVDRGANISRLCLPIHQNRNKPYIQSMVNLCTKLGIEIEAIANEFCFLNGCNCEGLYRRTCYDMNAHAESGDHICKYPRSLCIKAREEDPANWIRAKWILPQDMTSYEIKGIHRFKLTGRTHPTEFLLSILPYYMTRNFTGNLLELWPHLQTINSKNFKKDQEKVLSMGKIDTAGLTGFAERCMEICTNDCYTCSYCSKYYNKLVDLGHIS